MILVTGGTGLIGSHIILGLIREGYQVRALKRPHSDTAFIKQVFQHYLEDPEAHYDKIEWVNGDILDVLSLDDSMGNVEYVYHCAALVSFEPGMRKKLMELNEKGTANVVNACLNHSIKKLCYISSIAALGRPEDGEDIIDETLKWKASKFNTNYAISKYAGEREVWRGIAEGLHAIIVNPSIVLGISNPNKGSTRIFRSAWNGLKFYPPGINGFVDVEDVSRASVELMKSHIKNERFILNGINISYRELFKRIAEVLDKKPPATETSRWMLEAAWIFEAAKSLITGKKPLVTKETARTAGNRFRYSNTRIKEAIGFDFKDFDKTIAELGGYYSGLFSQGK
jgi:nucleoside-diphosphate-sugar epimerase